MKKIVLIATLCMFAGYSVAQKKAVKDAKSSMDKTAEARSLIKPALTHEETAGDQETWKIAGDIEYKAFEKEYDAEMTKEMTQKGGDLETMYTGIANMVEYYKKADELGELPDAKGKIKNKVRKDIVKNFKVAYPHYINGGIHYNDKGVQAKQAQNEEEAVKNFKKATDFFEMVWDIPSFKMFGGEKLMENDTTFQTIKYYAVISSIQAEDHERSISLLKRLIDDAPYIVNETYAESDPYELLCVEYTKAGDSISYINALKAGAQKFPKNKYFTPNLINEYIKGGDAQAALDYIDQAIKNDPESSCELLGLKGTLLSNDKKYDESMGAFADALEADANCEKALEGMGVLFVLKAQDLKEQVGHTTNRQELAAIDKETVDLYSKALPYLEKYYELIENRGADDYDIQRALHNLENVYYNLSLLNVDKNAELEKVQKKLGR